MTFAEKVEALKSKFSSMITTESAPEFIAEINNSIAELDNLSEEHNSVVEKNAKLTNTIVNMVTKEGSRDTPPNDETGSKPLTIEECISKIEKGEK